MQGKKIFLKQTSSNIKEELQRNCEALLSLFCTVKYMLPISLLFPWIGVVMISALFPEAGAVALHKIEAVEPLGAFVEVELGHD